MDEVRNKRPADDQKQIAAPAQQFHHREPEAPAVKLQGPHFIHHRPIEFPGFQKGLPGFFQALGEKDKASAAEVSLFCVDTRQGKNPFIRKVISVVSPDFIPGIKAAAEKTAEPHAFLLQYAAHGLEKSGFSRMNVSGQDIDQRPLSGTKVISFIHENLMPPEIPD